MSQSSSAGRQLTGGFTMATTCHHSAKQSTWRAWCQEDKAILPNGQFFLGWDNFWAMTIHPGVTLLFSDCSFHGVPTHSSQPPEITLNFTVFLSSETHIGREGECLFPRFFSLMSCTQQLQSKSSQWTWRRFLQRTTGATFRNTKVRLGMAHQRRSIAVEVINLGVALFTAVDGNLPFSHVLFSVCLCLRWRLRWSTLVYWFELERMLSALYSSVLPVTSKTTQVLG